MTLIKDLPYGNEVGVPLERVPGGTGVQSVRAGTNVTVDNTDPENPVVSSAASGVTSVVAGTAIAIDNTDPAHPVVSNAGVRTLVAGSAIGVDTTDPRNPIINNNGIRTIVAGTNVTVDTTDPRNPIVSASGGGGGSPSTLPKGFYSQDQTSTGISVPTTTFTPLPWTWDGSFLDDVLDLTDPENPVINAAGLYAVTCAVSVVEAGLAMGKQFFASLTLDTVTPTGGCNASNYCTTDAQQNSSVITTLTGVWYLPATAALALGVYHDVGSAVHFFHSTYIQCLALG